MSTLSNFGAINIEDIEAPKCFEIVEELTRRLDIPVFHDDQHGTAVVAVAGLLNALKVVKKELKTAKIVIFGAGAAGYGITKLLVYAGAKNILVLDSRGIIYGGRSELNKYKQELAGMTNGERQSGSLMDALKESDVFIGVSGQANMIACKNVERMNKRAIIFALSNPDAEMTIQEAKKGCAAVIATGRSDFRNQVNNSVCFPFIMRKILDEKIKRIDQRLLLEVARRIAAKVKRPTANKIIPLITEIKKI